MKHFFSMLILLFTLLLLYGRVGKFDYAQMDDLEYIVMNEAVRQGISLEGIAWAFTSFRMNNWHPLTWISHMSDVSFFGLAPGPQHLINVFLHGLNTFLFYAWTSTLIPGVLSPFVTAFLFLIHPLHVESVAWIAERKDVLSGFFYLLSLFFYTRYSRVPNLPRYGFLVFAFLLALLSKPMAVSLPVVLLLLDFWPLNRISTHRDLLPLIIEKIPLFILALGAGLVTMAAQASVIAPTDATPLIERLMRAIISYALYLRDLVMPLWLSPIYPLKPVDLAFFFISLSLLLWGSMVVFLKRQQYPWLLFGWLWFLITLLPVIGLIQVGTQSHADRYMYVPSIGLFLAAGAGISKLHDRALQKLYAPLVAIFFFYVLTAWIQIGYWANPYMLFTRALDVTGNSYQAHAGLSAYYLELGLLQEAESHAKTAMALHPHNPYVYANLGNVFFKKQDYQTAERFFRKALDILPHYAVAMNNLGLTLERQGRQEEARECYSAALKIDPGLAGFAENLYRTKD